MRNDSNKPKPAYPRGVLLVCALLAPLGRAEAQPTAAPRAELSVSAAPACVSVAALRDRVRARTRRIELVADAADAPKLRVTLRGEDGRELTAQLRVVWPDGRRSERHLLVKSCPEANDALAFLIVLTLDPSAAKQAAAGGGEAVPPGSIDAGGGLAVKRAAGETERSNDCSQTATGTCVEAAGQLSDEDQAPRAHERETSPPFLPARLPVNPSDSAEPAEAGSRGTFDLERFEVGLVVQSTAGVAPGVMLGTGLQLMAAGRGRGVWQPALQLRATRQWLNAWAADFGVADFRLDLVRLDVCPVGLRWHGLTGRGCLAAGLGSLASEGSATFEGRARSRFWAESGATLALGADLGRHFQVGVNVGLLVPMRRDSFAFRPEVFHRVAAVCFSSDLKLGVRFP